MGTGPNSTEEIQEFQRKFRNSLKIKYLFSPCFSSGSILVLIFGPHIKAKRKIHLGIFQNFHSGKYFRTLTSIFAFNLKSGGNGISF